MQKKDAYSLVTDRIMEALEAGIVPWRRPWRSLGGHGPTSLSTGKPYSGVNVWTLTATAQLRGYTSPYWVTFAEAKKRGGSVRKGEQSTPVVFWKWIERKSKEDPDAIERIPFLRYFYVFNVEQCDDVEAPTIEPLPEVDPIESAERIQANMPNRPTVKHGGDRACYSPTLDYVQVPLLAAFESPTAYYATLFHELIHSTAHESRVNRDTNGWQPFGSEDYSKEELVAEMGAAYLCGAAQLEPDYEQHASYIGSWLKRLQDDRKLVIQAAGAAAKASGYVLGETEGETATAVPSPRSATRRIRRTPRFEADVVHA